MRHTIVIGRGATCKNTIFYRFENTILEMDYSYLPNAGAIDNLSLVLEILDLGFSVR